MEARDRLEEELSEARQAMEAVQQQHDKLAADLQEVSSAGPASQPEDAARIAQLSDQVSPLQVILAPLGSLGEEEGVVGVPEVSLWLMFSH